MTRRVEAMDMNLGRWRGVGVGVGVAAMLGVMGCDPSPPAEPPAEATAIVGTIAPESIADHAVVVLLRRERSTDPLTVRNAAMRALGEATKLQESKQAPGDGAGRKRFELADGRGKRYTVTLASGSLAGAGDASALIGDPTVRQAAAASAGYVALDLAGAWEVAEVEWGYCLLERLASALAGDDCVAVYSSMTNRLVPAGADTWRRMSEAGPVPEITAMPEPVGESKPMGEPVHEP